MGVYIDKIDLMRLSKIRVAPARSVLDVLQGFNLIEIDLVRCGECKWFINEGSVTICDTHEQYIEPTDFCSYGERRTDEHNNQRA